MKKLFIFMLTALITFTSVYQLPVFANTNSTDISTKYTYYDDGSYMLEYIIDESNSGITRSSSTTTKSKIASYYSSSNVELWYVKVTGTFTYDGTSSKCTNSSVSATSYDKNWQISNRSASKSGSSATAKATGKLCQNGIVRKTINKSVTLTCSAKGTFS